VGGRSPEDRQRAAQERAARRAERARADAEGRTAPTPPPAPEPGPIDPDGPEPGPVPAVSLATTGSNGGDPAEHDELEPLPSARRRPTAVEERRPMSRAAKAQRIGRPGRPVLPPQSPKPKRWFRRFVALIALLAIGAALYAINATFQPFVSDDEQAGAVPVQIPKGADAGSIGRLLEAKGVVDDARFFEINATVTLRRNKLITGNYVLRRHMTNGAAIEALMQGPKVRVVKTFNVGVPEGLSRREAAKALAGSGIEGNYLKATRSRAASPMRARVSAGVARQSIIACARASTSPAGTSHPFSPCCTSSGMPAMKVVITGRRKAIASMMTTGSPSAKLGRTRARAARISSRTRSPATQPVMLTFGPRPSASIRASTSARISPSPASTSSSGRPDAITRRAASSSSSCPFCSQRRPTQTSLDGEGDAPGASRWNACSRPQWTTSTLGHAGAGSQRSNWLRPNELTATTKDARRPFSAKPSAPGLSNSSGPWTVKLYGGPPSSRASIATSAGLVPKWAWR